MPEEIFEDQIADAQAPAVEEAGEAPAEDAVEQPAAESAETAPEEGAGEQQADQEPEPKRKGGYQRKIERLERIAEQLADQNRILMEHLRSGAPVSAGQQKDDDKPPVYDENWEGDLNSYLEARDAWRDRKVQRQQEQQKRNEQERVYADRFNAARTRYSDFEDVISNADDVPMSPNMQKVILEIDEGPDVAYFLAKNPDEAKRIASMSPESAAVAIGKIAAKVTGSAAPPLPPKPKLTAAPAPPPRIPAAGKPPAASAGDPSLISDEEWRRLARQRRGA